MYVFIYASKISVKDIGSRTSMVLQNYQKIIEIASNMIHSVALVVGFKCPRKISFEHTVPPHPLPPLKVLT